MGRCVNHPKRESDFHCAKNDEYLCKECMKCADPDIYCKFRPSCNIWYMLKCDEEENVESQG
ncbi:MAG: hypothetical protein ABIH66_13185 [bacterium]